MPTYYNAFCSRAYWCIIVFYQINLNCNAAVLVLTARECTISPSLNARLRGQCYVIKRKGVSVYHVGMTSIKKRWLTIMYTSLHSLVQD